MNFKILSTKPIINLNSFIQIRDLFTSTFKILKPSKDNVQINYIASHTVESWEAGRPDKIASRYYDNIDYLEGMLKYNGISNPFSLNEGDFLLIPTKEVLNRSYRVLRFKGNRADEVKRKLERFADASKKSKVDSNKEAFNTSKKRNLPPNILRNGTTGTRKDQQKDKFILGNNLNNNRS